ncbi:Tyrosine-protein kinase-like otk [Toxocara canis]|uniref:Tyrosine-protein kinase-like otk n=1 Tax=Toxocara canis TaxID=6265 RepID=A0A0B2V998_TOXCA|nr:Tyrosine-protein kinase-like otk [Toxocara canis]
MKFIVALITFSSVVSDVTGVMNEYAEGNLQVLFNATSALSGDDYPQMAKVADLWCQVRSNVSKKLMPIKEAHFMRNVDMAMMPASVRNNQASLSFGWTSLHSSGKYRCQITTHQNQQILGWLFVNMRPVFHVDVASNFEIDKHDPFHVISPILRVTEGETLVIDCPILGFPQPTIEWLKDNASIDTSVQRITYEKKGIKIWNASLEAEGVYSCIGRNSFAEVDNGPIINWQSRLDITLQVKSMFAFCLVK